MADWILTCHEPRVNSLAKKLDELLHSQVDVLRADWVLTVDSVVAWEVDSSLVDAEMEQVK